MYWCSCDPSRAELVESLTFQLTPEDKFFVNSPECIHISVTKCMVSSIDELQDVSPDQEFTGICHQYVK